MPFRAYEVNNCQTKKKWQGYNLNLKLLGPIFFVYYSIKWYSIQTNYLKKLETFTYLHSTQAETAPFQN